MDIQGADITFIPDGNLYMLTNSTSRIYWMNTEFGFAVSSEVNISGKITGLATLPGTNKLLMSDTDGNKIIEVYSDGSELVEYHFENFTHTWGDMASSLCGLQ